MSALTLNPSLARRLAVTRQRLANPQPPATPAGIMDVMHDLGCLQLDPLRAVERTQYLVLWSRLGSYDRADLDQLLWQERLLFEYWAHAASIVLTEDYPLHQPEMIRFANGHNDDGKWQRRVRTWLDENESFRQHILQRMSQEGPLSADQIDDLAVTPWQSSGWTGGRNVTQALSFMWQQGDIVVAERQGLRKKWARTEQWLPQWADHEPWPEHQVVYEAAQRSLRALGVGTAKHIKKHFIRHRYPGLNEVVAELVAAEIILPVSIEDNDICWPGEWYIHSHDLPLLEQLQADSWQPRTTLLSPFDNLICDRDRTELMWDFFFRIEIYVPKAKRQYGYYVLPILHGERLIGRIDPRMDRKSGTLHVNAVYIEPNTEPDPVTGQAVADAVSDLANFLEARKTVYGKKMPKAWRPILRST